MSNETKITRRVSATISQQKKLAVIFAKQKEDGSLIPLDLSTVSNYLNETRYRNPKAKELREYAVRMLGCKWVTTIED